MQELLSKIHNIGLSEDMPEYLKRKVRISNQLAMIIMLFVAVPYVIISWVYFPSLAWIPVMGIFALIFVLFFHYMFWFKVGRSILALVPPTLATLYHAYLVAPGDPPISSFTLITLGFALLPFVIFDIKELSFLILLGLVMVFYIMGFNELTMYFVADAVNESIFRDGTLFQIGNFIGIGIAFANVIILSILNNRAERQAANLLEEVHEQNQSLQAKQDEMTNSLRKLEEAQEEERKRNWASEGLARFSTITREHNNLQELGDEMVKTLVSYLDANQAGFYVVTEEGDDRYIDLVACYAYDRKKYEEKRLEIGQGLLGQSYLENEYIHVTEIPEEYINITSGLGDAPPDNLIIIPLKVNEDVEGFFEIASFKEFKDYQVDWLHDLGQNIGAYIRNNRVNEQTRHLLNDSREQAEMLKSQEEEMRQNMEELAATQEEISRKEREYINRIEELEAQLNEMQSS